MSEIPLQDAKRVVDAEPIPDSPKVRVEPRAMTFWTPIQFLIGRRDAIVSIAATPGAIWLALGLVFTAALAREYDGEDLLSEPWHLFLPLVASLGTSFLLFLLFCFISGGRILRGTTFVSGYRMFVTLYWMTAPLAWMYAIPVERFLGAGPATAMNLRMLFLVSVWRVLLITRVVSVLYQIRFKSAFFPVMLFADTVAFFLANLVPIPVMAIMGGVHLSESEFVIADATFIVYFLSVLTFPIWFFSTLTMLFTGRFAQPPFSSNLRFPMPRMLWWIPASIAVVISLFLPATQAEQRLRHRVEVAVLQGDYRDAVAILNGYSQRDFPPHWDPPPRSGREKRVEQTLAMCEELARSSFPTWARQTYWAKFADLMGGYWYEHELMGKNLPRLIDLLESQPEGPAMFKEHWYVFDRLHERGDKEKNPIPQELRERIEKLLKNSKR